jgi:hypothetical protein
VSELTVKTPVDCEQWHVKGEEKCMWGFDADI